MIHPELNIPYQTWFPVAEQVRTGSPWYSLITKEQSDLIDKMVAAGTAFKAQRRKSTVVGSDDYKAFVMLCWIRTIK